MKIVRRQFLHLAAGAAVLPTASRIARAQAYPTRPITIVVPYAAGGQFDVVARVVGEHMRATLGQPVLIENVVGAGGTIGLRRVARAPSDGYTIVMGNWGTHVALGAIYQLDFDLLDFAPVAQLPGQPGMIATRKTLPVSNLRELIAWLKANQDKGVGRHFRGWRSISCMGGVLPKRYQCPPPARALSGCGSRHERLGGGSHRFDDQ
jgi:tripartite-type tricarboxylate transporter receptor subunit TctC